MEQRTGMLDQGAGVGTGTGTYGVDPSWTRLPWAFLLVALALIVISVTFVVTLLNFPNSFRNSGEVTAALSSLFTVVGTVVGTYFGIKVSSDTITKTTVGGSSNQVMGGPPGVGGSSDQVMGGPQAGGSYSTQVMGGSQAGGSQGQLMGGPRT